MKLNYINKIQTEKVLGEDSPAIREWPTVALTAAARLQGVLLHRVHAVRGNLDALRMAEAVLGGGLPGMNVPS